MEPIKAPQACHACRRLKRKCSKDLPACFLCIRLQKRCQYTEPASEESSRADAAPHTPSDISSTSAVGPFPVFSRPRQTFPSALFLDADYAIPLHASALSWGYQPLLEQCASTHLGSIAERVAVCNEYMATEHGWLPILSKKLLFKELDNSSTNPDAGLTLLLLCMKLVTRVPDRRAPDAPLYVLVKSLCSAAETSDSVSLRLVQSFVLMVYYEISHATYPAAFVNIGRAARLAALAGFSDKKASHRLFKPCDTWTLREECRRAWWAIFILDRFINVESHGMPFASPEPCPEQLLPVNDEEWDRGNIVQNEALYTRSFSNASALGSFAKMCQAAHLLGKVGLHVEERTNATDTASFTSEALHLHRTLTSLQDALESGESDLEPAQAQFEITCRLPALSVCVAARLKLYERYGCNDLAALARPQPTPEESELQRLSMDLTKMLALHTVPAMARAMTGGPLIARSLYHGAAQCAWFIREDHEPAMYDALKVIIDRLRSMGERWSVAGEYIDLLDQDGILILNNPDTVLL